MHVRYHVVYDGRMARIVEAQDGEWARFNAARVAAIAHIEEHLAECQATLWCLRRATSFWEYGVLVGATGRPVKLPRPCGGNTARQPVAYMTAARHPKIRSASAGQDFPRVPAAIRIRWGS